MRKPADNTIWREIRRWGLIGCVLGLSVGCVAGREQPPRPTPEEIRSDADRFFDKMEKEEEKQKSEPGSR